MVSPPCVSLEQIYSTAADTAVATAVWPWLEVCSLTDSGAASITTDYLALYQRASYDLTEDGVGVVGLMDVWTVDRSRIADSFHL